MRVFLVALISILQFLGIALLVLQSWVLGLILIVASYVTLGIIMFLLIKDRLREKKEEEENDYREY
ncbi:hypothetical protein [Pontibacillus marinus]|uniref:Uncharacterized protein n=1 Tax=Pontibacillus marinus BH030004 = DSM 16465 TaxID=1385511 RepID=A0A0A5FXL1_9BACI|nr:hypothetical protein [Pontibacillus marinus]KGX85541.1 hypothetical protein N783_14435 [Pontibacillus marinus BH030004 = DSM 16465]